MREKDFISVRENLQRCLKKGDGVEIARKAGLCYRVWRTAISRNSWEELTAGEMKAVIAAIAFVKERNELVEYAENL
jgi:hypothetical protein